MACVQGVMAFDDDFLDLTEQACFNQELEVLAGHPGEDALQSGAGVYADASGPCGGASAIGIS